MKNIPINNGKDVPKVEIDEIHTIGGIAYCAKMVPPSKSPMLYEPKKINRWSVKFEGKGYEGISLYVLKKTHRPKLINGSWSDIRITLYDLIGPSTAQALMEGIRSEWQVRGKEIPNIKYKLNMLDPTGVAIEEWLITGKLKEVDFGDLDYCNAEIVEIKLLIEPISVILNY